MRNVGSDVQLGHGYALKVGELWTGLSLTLARLEELAAEPRRLDDDDTLDLIRRLQYRLHSASEYTLGLNPPVPVAAANEEIVAALVGARDSTAEIVAAAETFGSTAVTALVHEWRGSLFRVRLAQLRLTGARTQSVAPAPAPHPQPLRTPIIASALTVLGGGIFAIGATFGPWPLWVAGMLIVCGSMLFYRL